MGRISVCTQGMAVEDTDMRAELKKYLGKYYRAKVKKQQLENRLRNFRIEMIGARGVQLSPVPGGKGGIPASATENAVIRAMEIEERIAIQQAEVQRAMLDVMDVIGFLPLDSTERTVLEYRHVDCMSWKKIYKEMCMTSTPCFRYYNIGIDLLLEKEEVMQLIKESNKKQ